VTLVPLQRLAVCRGPTGANDTDCLAALFDDWGGSGASAHVVTGQAGTGLQKAQVG
jgi:hypothetical protein